MESLENKIDRLSPEQRKEAEDFVDFLLFRCGQEPVLPSIQGPFPSARNIAPPPLTTIEPVHVVESTVFRSPDPSPSREKESLASGNSDVSPLIREIGGGSGDASSHDYLDYGRFEQQHLPAADAVKNVKAKLSRSEDQKKSNHLLDWIE